MAPSVETGWFSREDPRMHIQTVDSKARQGKDKAKVWLEDRGKRIFEVDLPGSLSFKELKSLESRVRSNRASIEAQWIQFMAENNWLKASIQGHVLNVEAYPGHRGYTRKIDLRKVFPGAYDSKAQKIG